MGFNQAIKLIKQRRRIKAAISNLPNIAGVIAVNHFKESFRNQGFTDETVEKWEPRQRADRGRVGSRGILIKSGRLRKSIRYRKTGPLSVKITSSGTATKYAGYHNEGTSRLPKRQFVGNSKVLNKKILAKIRREIKRAKN